MALLCENIWNFVPKIKLKRDKTPSFTLYTKNNYQVEPDIIGDAKKG